jgi:hypothetical protein
MYIDLFCFLPGLLICFLWVLKWCIYWQGPIVLEMTPTIFLSCLQAAWHMCYSAEYMFSFMVIHIKINFITYWPWYEIYVFSMSIQQHMRFRYCLIHYIVLHIKLCSFDTANNFHIHIRTMHLFPFDNWPKKNWTKCCSSELLAVRRTVFSAANFLKKLHVSLLMSGV